MIMLSAFLLLQPLEAPGAPQGDELRIVAVEQLGKPPYKPQEGRVYRLEGSALSRVGQGALLVIKRPGDSRGMGLLRVISVREASTALASLEVKGETFPLKGDLVLTLSPMGLPEISPDIAAIKEAPPFPLNPLVIPSIPITSSIEVKAAQTPFNPMSLEEITYLQSAQGYIHHFERQPKFLEQNPIYFLKGSAVLSQKGVENLEAWVSDWGQKGLNYFLAVPQNQLHLERLTVERLAELKWELKRLGVTEIGLRTYTMNNTEPYDAVYVGVED